jgi:hypothetical protein
MDDHDPFRLVVVHCRKGIAAQVPYSRCSTAPSFGQCALSMLKHGILNCALCQKGGGNENNSGLAFMLGLSLEQEKMGEVLRRVDFPEVLRRVDWRCLVLTTLGWSGSQI